MNESVYEVIEQASSVLRLDFNSVEFANLIQENMLAEEDAISIALVFEYLQRKKKNATDKTFKFVAFSVVVFNIYQKSKPVLALG